MLIIYMSVCWIIISGLFALIWALIGDKVKSK
jgi:hypothetical protein